MNLENGDPKVEKRGPPRTLLVALWGDFKGSPFLVSPFSRLPWVNLENGDPKNGDPEVLYVEQIYKKSN